MKTILIPLDGSVEAESVLPFIPYVASSLDARARLLRVLPDHPTAAPVLHEIVDSYGVGENMVVAEPARPTLDERRRFAEEEHLSALIELRAQGVEAELEVQVGHPAEVIVEAAAANHVALIAMATHGYSGLRRWALGSVTDKVIHAAPVPVFVVRSARPEFAEAPALKRVLVPLDRSALARKALPAAAQLAAAAGAQLLLLHVIPSPVISSVDAYMSAEMAQLYLDSHNQQRANALTELQQIADQLQTKHGLNVSYDVRIGFAAEEIVEAAERHDIDLVVMATHGYSGLQRWALGSVADKVLHACSKPLLLVRAGEVSA